MASEPHVRVRVLTDPLGWFTLEIPEDWEASTEDCVTTVRHPGGPGTLYLSGARHVRGRQQSFGGADFLVRFLNSLGVAVDEGDIRSTTGPGCRIYALERDDPKAHWRHWSITDDETALLVSYMCLREHATLEQDTIDGIVRSVRLYHSAPS
jgi:hypothetical protein